MEIIPCIDDRSWEIKLFIFCCCEPSVIHGKMQQRAPPHTLKLTPLQHWSQQEQKLTVKNDYSTPGTQAQEIRCVCKMLRAYLGIFKKTKNKNAETIQLEVWIKLQWGKVSTAYSSLAHVAIQCNSTSYIPSVIILYNKAFVCEIAAQREKWFNWCETTCHLRVSLVRVRLVLQHWNEITC